MTGSLIASPPEPRGHAVVERTAVVADTPYEDVAARPGLTLADLLSSLWRQKTLFLTCLVILLAIGISLIHTLRPTYSSDALLMIDPRQTHITDLQAVQDATGTTMSDLNFVRSEMQILTSDELARQVVDALDLQDNPEFAGHPGLWDRFVTPLLERVGLTQPAGPPPTLEERVAATVAAYKTRFSAYNDTRSFIIDVSFTAENPALAQRILAKHVAIYLDDQTEAKQLVIRKAESWFNTELDQLQAKLLDAEAAQQSFRLHNSLLRTGGETVLGRQLSDLTSQLAAARIDLQHKEARYRQLTALSAHPSTLTSADTSLLSSELVQHLLESESAAAQTVAQLHTRVGDSHPQMLAAKANLAEVQTKLAAELGRLVVSAQADTTIARDNVQQLDLAVQGLEKQVGASSMADLTATQLSRETDAERRLYDDLLARSKQVAVQRETQEPDARIVSNASLPLHPTSPRFLVLGVVAVTGSALAAAAIAIGRDLLSGRRFRNLAEVEAETGFPGLAMLPSIKMPRRDGPIVPDPRSPMWAALGVLRNSIFFSCPVGKPIAVVVASAIAGDGKTVVSALLAKSLAAGGKRVLLIDADLHRAGLSRLMRLPSSAGLADVLQGRKTLAECVVREQASGIDVLAVGETTVDATSILSQDRVAELLESARLSYDVTVVDTPPIAAVDDAVFFGSAADATVLVVRWASTPFGVVGGAIRRLRLAGANVVGSVLNATVASRYHQADLEAFRLSGKYFLQKS